MKSSNNANNATWNVFILLPSKKFKATNICEQTVLNIKMKTQLKWTFINKIKDVNKEAKLSKVQAQTKSGISL